MPHLFPRSPPATVAPVPRMAPARRTWVMVLVACFVTALAAWPGAASAAVTITEANLNGVVSVSSPPGGVFLARVTAVGDPWLGTRFRFGNQGECVGRGGGPNNAVSFNVTAPGDPGTYDAGFTATGAADCGGEQSAEKVLTNALKVTSPATNPALPQRCGINVMLVLDESGSIASSGATEKVRRATRAFLNALSGTGCKVSIVDFSTTASWPVGYHMVTGQVDSNGMNASGTIGEHFEPYLKDGYKPAGWTNWEDAFHQVKVANDGATKADLVVFMTDGDPTARNTNSGGTDTGLVEGEAEALERAAAEADRVKGQGSRVFALGVGAAVTKPTSARRLTAISGFNRYPATPFRSADYTLVQDFDDLGQALREIVAELCGAGVTVTKYVDKGDGRYVADRGWAFTVRVSVPDGFSWIRPKDATGASATANTDDTGIARFLWRPTKLTDTSTVEVVDEELKDGYSYVAERSGCRRQSVRRNRRRTFRRTSPPIAEDYQLAPGEFLTCEVYNRINPGTITIEKDATPQGSQAFDFTGSLGPFTLVDDRPNESVSRTFPNRPPGTYRVNELVPNNWALTGIACTPEAAATTTGTEVAITLVPEGAVTCTFNDRRIDPLAPPEPDPPPPAPLTPLEPAPPPTPPPSTKLRVVKTMPSVARVGQRIGFRLTVTNVGSVAARRVRMVDLPPGAVALAALRSTTRARVVNGGAVWNLGRLAPGAKRTIRGSVLITAGTPGLKRNLVVATAVNAQLVGDRADTRLRARRQAPPVTG